MVVGSICSQYQRRQYTSQRTIPPSTQSTPQLHMHTHTHARTGLIQDLNTSSDPPPTQVTFELSQDPYISGASTQTHTQFGPTHGLAASASARTDPQFESTQVLSSGTSLHTHTQPEPTRDLNNSSSSSFAQTVYNLAQCHNAFGASTQTHKTTFYPVALDIIVDLVRSFTGTPLQGECMFVGTRMSGFRFMLENNEVEYWVMGGGLQVFSHDGISARLGMSYKTR